MTTPRCRPERNPGPQGGRSPRSRTEPKRRAQSSQTNIAMKDAMSAQQVSSIIGAYRHACICRDEDRRLAAQTLRTGRSAMARHAGSVVLEPHQPPRSTQPPWARRAITSAAIRVAGKYAKARRCCLVRQFDKELINRPRVIAGYGPFTAELARRRVEPRGEALVAQVRNAPQVVPHDARDISPCTQPKPRGADFTLGHSAPPFALHLTWADWSRQPQKHVKCAHSPVGRSYGQRASPTRSSGGDGAVPEWFRDSATGANVA